MHNMDCGERQSQQQQQKYREKNHHDDKMYKMPDEVQTCEQHTNIHIQREKYRPKKHRLVFFSLRGHAILAEEWASEELMIV